MPTDSPPLVPVRAETATETDAKVKAIKNLVARIARALVDQPEMVQVRAQAGRHYVVIELTVNPNDTGKVIGKKGIYADAIRRLIHAIGGKDNLRYVLEIVDLRT